jgi:hypothetical protein
MIVRIMIMVPLYAVSSLISLFFPRGYVVLLVGRGVHGLTRHVTAAFFIDAIRDIYEVRLLAPSATCALPPPSFKFVLTHPRPSSSSPTPAASTPSSSSSTAAPLKAPVFPVSL